VRRFVAVRLLHAIVVLFLVTTIAFFMVHLAPGDPFGMEGSRLTPELREQLRVRFGYDRPLLEQYGRYLANVSRGELGFSHSLQLPVATVLRTALPRTLLLMGVALTLSFALGMWLGVFEARRFGTAAARATNALTMVLYSLPAFWLGLMVVLLFGYWIPILPAGGMRDVALADYMSPGEALVDRLKHLVLPVLSLVLWTGAYVARYQRAALLEVLPLDFIRTARAKGVPHAAVVSRHGLRNALLPMITLAGYVFPYLLGGAVVIERIYAWPGMGWLATNAIASRDYPLVIAAVLVAGIMVAVGNLLADIGYGLADPRIRAR
jgi:peptide/nickel transport system permease protein